MTRTDAFDKIQVESSAELRAWLERNHEQQESVWLMTFKKDAGSRYVSTGEVLDELICFGWIDGIRRKLDDDRTMQLISPRKTQHWARSYKNRAARLIEDGRMHEAGLRCIEAGKKSGLWDFMDDVDALVVPDDLAEALAALPEATDNFDAFPPSYRRNILRWIKLAKRAETRAQRITKTAETSARNQKIRNM